MAKLVYKHYVIYMLQNYIQIPEPALQTEAERLNRKAAEATLSELDARSKDIIMRVFGSCRHLEDSVGDCANVTGISPSEIWHVVKSVCRRVAELRGLI